MPELPEVETVRKGLEERLRGFLIHQIEVCRDTVIASPGGAEEFAKNLKGSFVGGWSRRGKYLIASLHKRKEYCKASVIAYPSGGWWGVHLRMTGSFEWHNTSTEPPCKHTRIRIWNERGNELRYVDIRSFGQMWWVPKQNKPEEIITGLQKLGPEPFSKSFNATYLEKSLRGRKKTIKAALLDQSIIAGTGNIYADESLFAAGISPHIEAGKLNFNRIEILCEKLIEVLAISIGSGGTTFSDFRNLEGLNGNYGGQAWVYGRHNKGCRKCGSKIKKDKISGRSSHWCPQCQK